MNSFIGILPVGRGLPGDLVKLAHRAIRGEDYREAGKWTYRCAGVLLVCSIAVLCAAIGTHGQS